MYGNQNELAINPNKLYKALQKFNSFACVRVDKQKLKEEDSFEYDNLVIKWRWLVWLLTHNTPVTDSRLKSRVLEHSDVSGKAHIPNDLSNPVFAGESSSWNFLMSSNLGEIWKNIQLLIIKAIAESNNISSLEAKLVEFTKNIDSDTEKELTKLVSLLEVIVPGFSREKIFAGDSGSAVLNAARDLFAPNSYAITTKENGSQILTYPNTEALLIRTNDNKVRSNNCLFQEWVKKTESTQAKFFSITLISKSGLRFDQENGLAINLLNYATKYNKANPSKPIRVVIDVVQSVGRNDLKEVFKLFNLKKYSDTIVGAIFTGSKAPGKSPHAGFFALTDFGLKLLEARVSSLSQKELEQIVEKHSLVGVTQFDNLHNGIIDYMASLRIADNVQGIRSSYDENGDLLFKEKLKTFNKFYVDFFKLLGFKVLKSGVNSIISLETPVKNPGQLFDSDDVNKKFLTYLAQYGVSMGGFLKEGEVPILRWGISANLLLNKLISEDILIQELYGVGFNYTDDYKKLKAELDDVNSLKNKLTILSQKSGLLKIFALGLLELFKPK